MVDFPIKDLDLTNYMPPLLHPNDDKTGMYSQKAYSHEDPRLQVPAYKYELYAVTNHYGSLSSGHCQSSIHCPIECNLIEAFPADTSYIASNGGWQYYDDSRVAAADARDVVVRFALGSLHKWKLTPISGRVGLHTSFTTVGCGQYNTYCFHCIGVVLLLPSRQSSNC